MTDNLYIDEEKEYEFCLNLEKVWKDSLPRLSEAEWLEIFPEAREILPEKIKEWDIEKKRLIDIAKRAMRKSVSKSALETHLALQVFVLPGINEAEKRIEWLRYATRPTNNLVVGHITDADIQRARIVPIISLISSSIRHTSKIITTKCPLHEDRSPSFVIYTETNSCWCFGCQQGGDSIALVRLLHNLSFTDAVNYLNRI